MYGETPWSIRAAGMEAAAPQAWALAHAAASRVVGPGSEGGRAAVSPRFSERWSTIQERIEREKTKRGEEQPSHQVTAVARDQQLIADRCVELLVDFT